MSFVVLNIILIKKKQGGKRSSKLDFAMSDVCYGVQVFFASITFKRYFEEGLTDGEFGKIKRIT